MSSGKPITIAYKKTLTGLDIYCDIWPPKGDAGTAGPRPAVIYFHGGGLTVGNSKSWFPTWIYDRIIKLGYIFISADYQLLPTATGHDILEDIKDLWKFLTDPELVVPFPDGQGSLKIRSDAIVLAGSSAGGVCVYLAAMHCVSPKPKAILSVYGMFGDVLTSCFLTPKKEVCFLGRELLDPAEFQEFLFPFPKGLPPPTSNSPLAYHPATYRIPGYPANPRQLLARLYLQLGVFLDYYTGEHEPSLSSNLRQKCDMKEHRIGSKVCVAGNESRMHALQVIPNRHLHLFPQFNVSNAWPPTILLHGTSDTAVPFSESQHMHATLEAAGVPVRLVEFEGQEHTFDYAPDAEQIWGAKFDDAIDFLCSWIAG